MSTSDRTDDFPQGDPKGACSSDLAERGEAFPRFCARCGIGPCKHERTEPTILEAVRASLDLHGRSLFADPPFRLDGA